MKKHKTIAYNSKLIFALFMLLLLVYVFYKPIVYIIIALTIFFIIIRVVEKHFHVDPPLTPIEEELKTALRKDKVKNFEMQYKIDKYVVDFAFPKEKIVIECDSKEFHNTEERFKKDRVKDRVLQKLGWKVLRFTGSEILSAPESCVSEVKDMLTIKN